MYKFVMSLFFLSFLYVYIDENPVEATKTENVANNLERTLHVNHHVRGNDVYLECMIPNFTFKESGGHKNEGEGHLNVIVDGQRTEKISTAAFIIKGLTKGEHTLKIKVVHNDLTNYNLDHTIHVQIK